MSNTFDWDLGKLSPTQKKIADFIEKNAGRLPYLVEKDIAEGVGTSAATVSRFWQAVGYANLKEFKNSFRELEAITPANKMKHMMNKISSDDLLSSMLEQTAGYLQDTANNLVRRDFERAVETMAEASRIYVFAPGPSEGLGRLLQFRLNRIGVDIRMIDKNGQQLFEFLVNLTAEDTIVMFGFFNIVPEIKVILDFAAEQSCRTVVITDRLVSDLNARTDILLYVCRGQLWEFHSMVAPTAVVESLVIAIGQRTESKALPRLDHLQALRRKYANYIPK